MEFLSETIGDGRKWHDILQVQEKKSTQNFISREIFFGSEWEVKAFSDKENIKEFSPQTYPKGMAKESS